MRKGTLTALVISVYLISLAIGTQILGVARANPYMYKQESGKVTPLSGVEPPIVTIHSPQNTTVYDANNVYLNLTVTVVVPTLPELFYYYLELSEVYYKASWLPNSTYIDIAMVRNSIPRETTFSNESYAKWKTFIAITGYTLSPSFSINLTGIPDGSHFLEVFAVERGARETYESASPMTIHYGCYELFSSSLVNFTIDTTSPKISNLSLINTTSNPSDVILSFNVNEASTVFYSLDNQANTTIAGNTTLTGLKDGLHSLTVYANDTAGNVGKSGVAFFTVNSQPLAFPSPTITSIPTQKPTSVSSEASLIENFFSGLGIAGVAVATVATVMLFYFEKRGNKHEQKRS